MKKAARSGLIGFLLATSLYAANLGWQAARIVSVSQSTETKSTVWVVNTPVTQEETVYVITVHVRDKIVTGSYTPGEAHPAPPGEWTKDHPVQAQLVGDYLYLRSSPTDEVRARISKTKPAPPVRPWTPEESEALKTSLAPAQEPDSMVGFDVPSTKASAPAAQAPAVVQAPPPPPAEPTTGSVSVSSVPFLAEVFVDGESMGYTPAKLRLPPGKHSFRCEKSGYKPWTKEITITAGSELSLDATLPLEKK
jgi:PEGA domain